MKQVIRLFAALAVLGQLAACGGGGGASGTTGSTGGSTGGTVTPATPTLTVALTDKGTGTTATSISPTSPAIATVTLKDSAGAAVSGAIVTFTVADSSLATLTPTSGTALTNSSGVATVQVNAASISSAGATSITAASSVTTSTTTTAVSGSRNFAVGAASAGLAGLSNGLAAGTSLSPYSTTSISATVTGVPTNTPVTVSFASVCTTSGKATLPATAVTVNGVATATYTDKACAGQDTITIGIAGTTVAQTLTLNVTAPTISSVQFVSSSPSTIVIKGVGSSSQVDTSIVKFRVVDNNNNPIASVPVVMDLTTRSGGILLKNAASGTITETTDATGVVSVPVTAGTTPTPVWVTASVVVGGQTFTTQSNLLTISTGRAAQDRTSLSVASHNIEGFSFDGTTTTARISLADRVGNPVPDGTSVNFIADGASIQPNCTTVAGVCSVTFTSGNPRATGKTEPAGIVTAGRVKILAYALGEESFTDMDGDNVFDAGEAFNNLGDVFLDSNENGSFDATEQAIAFGTSTSSCGSNGIATSPAAPSKPNTCDSSWGSAHVRQEATIVLSGSNASIGATRPTGSTPASSSATSATTMNNACIVNHLFWAYDENRNPLPSGTTIAISGALPTGVSGTITPATVQDSVTPGGTPHVLTVNVAAANCPLTVPVGYVLSFTTPHGVVSAATLTVNQ